MKISSEGLAFIAKQEGDVLHVYRDVAGYKTIGVGHLLTKTELATGIIKIDGLPVAYTDGITEAQSLALLSQDVVDAEDAVNRLVKVELSQSQFDALVSFTFNCGEGALAGSTLLKLLNASQYDQIPAQLARWNKAGGKVCDALVSRRKAEGELWQA